MTWAADVRIAKTLNLTHPLFFTCAVFVWTDAPFTSLIYRTFEFFCALALSASVSPLIVPPSPFGGSFERDVAILRRGPVQRAVLGKVPELPTFSTLVRQPGVENSLGCCVSGSGTFGHGWYPDDPGQLAYVLDLNRDHGPRRSLDVQIRRFYVKNLPNATGHDG